MSKNLSISLAFLGELGEDKVYEGSIKEYYIGDW